MDIVTHAMIGSATAAGLFQSHPGLAIGVMLGNVAPDLDAFSRLAGKRAFLRFHQTYTHSLGAIVAVVAAAAAMSRTSETIWSQIGFGLGIGMAMHVLLDLTNTYGVRCLWPLSRKRYSLDWIFFIDAWILAGCFVILLSQCVFWKNHSALHVLSLAFLVGLILFCAVRGLIAWRARRLVAKEGASPAAQAIIPTTWSPFRFLVCLDRENVAETFILNASSGKRAELEKTLILDDRLPAVVTDSREWDVMRQLSGFYHCVDAQQTEDEKFVVVCKDLRIRNFNTKFGTLTCYFDRRGNLLSKEWEV